MKEMTKYPAIHIRPTEAAAYSEEFFKYHKETQKYQI